MLSSIHYISFSPSPQARLSASTQEDISIYQFWRLKQLETRKTRTKSRKKEILTPKSFHHSDSPLDPGTSIVRIKNFPRCQREMNHRKYRPQKGVFLTPNIVNFSISVSWEPRCRDVFIVHNVICRYCQKRCSNMFHKNCSFEETITATTTKFSHNIANFRVFQHNFCKSWQWAKRPIFGPNNSNFRVLLINFLG